MADFYKSKGLWHSYSYTPKPGDLIFYSESNGGSACHVGLVISVSDGYVYTKEGNTTNGEISSRSRKVGASWIWHGWYIKGYASPGYAEHSCSYALGGFEPYSDAEHKVIFQNCRCGSSKKAEIQSCDYGWSGLTYECKKCRSEYAVHEDGRYVAANCGVKVYRDSEGFNVLTTVPKGTVLDVSGSRMNAAGCYVGEVLVGDVSGYVYLRDLMLNGSAGVHEFVDGVCLKCELSQVFSDPGGYIADRNVTLYKRDAWEGEQRTVKVGDKVLINQVGVTTYGCCWGYTADGYVVDMGSLTKKVSEWPMGNSFDLEDGVYVFLHKGDDEKVLTALGSLGSANKGALVLSRKGAGNQYFSVLLNADGSVAVQNAASGLVLEVRDWPKGMEATISQGVWDDDDCQKWYPEIGSNGLILLRSKASNLYLGTLDEESSSELNLAQRLPDDSGACSFTANMISDAVFKRLAGTGYNRYSTMDAIATEGFGATGGTVIVAYSLNYPDALAASGLAGIHEAPIVLTDTDAMTDLAIGQLERLKPSKVIVVGSEGVVSENVVNEIAAAAPNAEIERYYGSDRYATALDIYNETEGWGNTAIVAGGLTFADALSISPYAYATKSPIFLTSGSGTYEDNPVLNEASIEAIRAGGFERIVVVGGETCVDTAALAASLGIEVADLKVLAGKNRYETSALIAEFAVSEGLSYDGMAIATGDNFPDALTGGPLCGKNGSVLLLAGDSLGNGSLDVIYDVVGAHAGSIDFGYFLGSEHVVTGVMVNAVYECFESSLRA